MRAKMPAQPLIVADIFCGAGGLSAGFAAAHAWWSGNSGERYQIAFGVDKDPDAIRTFRSYHFPDLSADRLEQVTPCKEIADITVMAASIRAAIRPYDH